MRFTRPSRSPTLPPLPRQAPTAMEPDPWEPDPVEPPEPAEPAARVPRWNTSKLSRPRVVTAVFAAGAAAGLLCWGAGWVTDPGRLTVGRDHDAATERSAAVQAAAERAAGRRAAEDKARARRLAAAQAADARAAAERAARARAEHQARTRRRVVAMPALVGLRLDRAMDVAAEAGLTGVAVCRTPGGDTPLWWSNWHVTGQAVRAGTRIDVGRLVCLSAMKR